MQPLVAMWYNVRAEPVATPDGGPTTWGVSGPWPGRRLPSPNPSANPVGVLGEAWQPLSLPHQASQTAMDRLRRTAPRARIRSARLAKEAADASELTPTMVEAARRRRTRPRLRPGGRVRASAPLPRMPRYLRCSRPLLPAVPHCHARVALRLIESFPPPVCRFPRGHHPLEGHLWKARVAFLVSPAALATGGRRYPSCLVPAPASPASRRNRPK